MDSPNLKSLDAWAVDPRKVEKPWGYELIWAEADAYVGKVLFVRAGESLSLQFHRQKDESWLVQSGRAKLELGPAGDAILNEEVIGPTVPDKMPMPLKVHRREGEPCPRCGVTLAAVHFAEHSTTYCPAEQTGGRVLKDRRLSKLLK